MARFKDTNFDQMKMVAIAFSDQIQPGSFEYTLSYLVDHVIDLKPLRERYKNDDGGCPAYDPAILLKIIFYAYSNGIVSSRKIEQACRRDVKFMALSADSQPHFTTLANFVSSMDGQIIGLFRDVLLYCDELGLIGKDMFAVDGCKMPSNASKRWSGTRSELRERKKKMEMTVDRLVASHRERDRHASQQDEAERDARKIKKMKAQIDKLKRFIDDNDDNIGPSGKVRKSNVTDNESAKMKTSHGTIQGYNGQAMVDAKHQIVVNAEAYGEGSEQQLLAPMVKSTRELLNVAAEKDVFAGVKLLADAGYHSNAVLKYLDEQRIDGYIPDRGFRLRDPDFAGADRHRERHRKEMRKMRDGSDTSGLFKPKDFDYDPQNKTCTCPAGEKLYRNGGNVVIRGRAGSKFTAPQSACGPCALRAQCLRHPDRTPARQVVFFKSSANGSPETLAEKMVRKLDTWFGKAIYKRRLGTVEPVFANLKNKGLARFTLRGKRKVDTQWKLFSMIHNIEKIHHYGPAFT